MSNRQAEAFARRKGGRVVKSGVGTYSGSILELPDALIAQCERTHGGRVIVLPADVCNGELFCFPGPSPFESYPSGNPIPLSVYAE